MSGRCLTSAREAILATLPEETSLHGHPPDPRFTHLPASHAKALHPDAQVVVGMRGSGKSFWWAALQEERLRRLVAARAPGLQSLQRAEVRVGFGERPDPDRYPGRDVLSGLLRQGLPARTIWRTVLLHALAGSALPSVLGGASSWKARVQQVADQPEAADRLLQELDRGLAEEERHIIVLFDALDRAARDREAMNRLIRGLLEIALDLRPYRRLRLKCFLRTDQLDRARLASFPDASKVLSSRVELSWPPRELYAMLFQYLANAEDGRFREEAARAFSIRWKRIEGVWAPPPALVLDQEQQRQVFHAIAGPWMGRDPRRGFPYTWIPGHLADAHGRTAPRSFLAALRAAAADTAERHPNHHWPLHHESIKRGVQRASAIRRDELQEDHPWVHACMEPLRGKIVPCSFHEIAQAWKSHRVMEKLAELPEAEGGGLPPARLREGPTGLRTDLEELGIFLRMADGRVNIPDVFRIAYGLGRKGGVKPLPGSRP
jgi:hypothetical protein